MQVHLEFKIHVNTYYKRYKCISLNKPKGKYVLQIYFRIIENILQSNIIYKEKKMK